MGGSLVKWFHALRGDDEPHGASQSYLYVFTFCFSISLLDGGTLYLRFHLWYNPPKRGIHMNITLKECFTSGLPLTLQMSHYDLAARYPDFSIDEWRRFLQDNDRFITKETALLTEVNARKGLEKLGQGALGTGEATAISNLLKQSEQLNASAKEKVQMITMFMPDPKDREIKDYSRKAVYAQNMENVKYFFDSTILAERVARREIVINADGTLHFTNLTTYSHPLDTVYSRMFNPENALIESTEDVEEEWQ